MKFKSLFILALFTLCVSQSIAGTHLQGIIIDEETGRTIPDANIVILETGQGTASRQGGYFTFRLEPGNYTLDISVMGYKPYRKVLAVSKDLTVTVPLKSSPVSMNPVVVTAALSEHLKSNISASVTVLTLKEMKTLCGNTAGEVLETVPGIYFRSYDGIAGNQIPSIRGSNTDQVVVLHYLLHLSL